MTHEDLLDQLRALEVELHQPEVRSDPIRVGELLHESFTEVGRSGRRFSRDAILGQLKEENPQYEVWSGHFAVQVVMPGLALLTYQSARVDANGKKSRFALRSSLWQETAGGWQVRFHQATPAAGEGVSE